MDVSNNKPLQEYLDSLSHDELVYLISRYCGPNNILLFDRKFSHFHVDRIDFEKEAKRRIFTTLLEESFNS